MERRKALLRSEFLFFVDERQPELNLCKAKM